MRFISELGAIAIFAGRTALRSLRPPWFFREMFRQTALTVERCLVPVIAVVAPFGMVITLQGLVMTRPFGVERMLSSILAISLLRELSPGLTGIMMAAQAGSAGPAEQAGGHRAEGRRGGDAERLLRAEVVEEGALGHPCRPAQIIDAGRGKALLPDQHQGGVSAASLNVKKEIQAWKFHLAAYILVQKSSNSEIHDLPLFTTKSSFFFEHLFRFKETNGELNTQLGIDVLYHTYYYPYEYMPSTGRFYRQDRIKTGNYPFIDVFLNLKLKRTRIFIMFDHLNSGYMGYDYFMIPSYPMNARMLRYGIAWTFYN